MKIAICDDEQIFLNEIHNDILILCEKIQIEAQISCFDTGAQLLDNVSSFDVVFLDIEIKKENGMEIAYKIHANYPEIIIIFLSSHDELVFEGYKVNAFRFIPKPIDLQKLEEALLQSNKRLISDMLEIKYKNHSIFINQKEIVYIEARKGKHGTIIHLSDIYSNELMSSQFTDTRSLNEIENSLNMNSFFRIHRCIIINYKYVTNYDRKQITLRGYDGTVFHPLSRGKFEEFKKDFLLFKLSD